jgi:hypothetical protein
MATAYAALAANLRAPSAFRARSLIVAGSRSPMLDCQRDNLKAETEKAVKALAKELESATIEGP